jgi:hypothetical protein
MNMEWNVTNDTRKDYGLLEYDAVHIGTYVPTAWRNLLLSPSCIYFRSTLNVDAASFSENGRKYLTNIYDFISRRIVILGKLMELSIALPCTSTLNYLKLV